MDLGIEGRVALVLASSKGLGLACATSLAGEGCRVFINGRDKGRLEAAARKVEAETGRRPEAIVADINTEDGRAEVVRGCPAPDILVNNNGGPEPALFEDWTDAGWALGVQANLLTPVFFLKAYVPGMRQRKFGRVVNITSAMVKSPSIRMGISAAVRAGITAASKSVQRTSVIDNVTINNMLPERFNTDRQVFMAERMVKTEGITIEQARARIADTIAAKRLGDPKEFGDACAFLCSAQAGFISGQNLQLDGGSYAGLI
jgi:3-oxoacyl-[acyl-carrier protein] reductase